jgi:hypothetical protein
LSSGLLLCNASVALDLVLSNRGKAGVTYGLAPNKTVARELYVATGSDGHHKMFKKFMIQRFNEKSDSFNVEANAKLLQKLLGYTHNFETERNGDGIT